MLPKMALCGATYSLRSGHLQCAMPRHPLHLGLEFLAGRLETMSWNEVDVDDQRMQFVLRAASGKESMTVLCREFTISRPTGYHWRRRYREVHLLSDLRERSPRPHHSPRLTAARTEQRGIALLEQTGWRAKKPHVLLAEAETPLSDPTIHRRLGRHQLISAYSQ